MIDLIHNDIKYSTSDRSENFGSTSPSKFKFFGYITDLCENTYLRYKPRLKGRLTPSQLRFVKPIQKISRDGSTILLPPGPAVISMDANHLFTAY